MLSNVYAECRVCDSVTMRVILLSVAMLIAVILNVVAPSRYATVISYGHEMFMTSTSGLLPLHAHCVVR
jgi:hypothetical protein